MNDYNRQHQSPEKPHVPAIENRLRVTGTGEALLDQAVNNTPADTTARQMFTPKHEAAPAPVSSYVEFSQPELAASLPAAQDGTKLHQFPGPNETQPYAANQPAVSGEVVEMDQYRMAEEARERLNAA